MASQSENGLRCRSLLIDWEKQQAMCPEGHTSSSWTQAIDKGTNEVIKIKFSTTDCQACPARSLCTQSIRDQRRTVTIRPQEQYVASKRGASGKRRRNFSRSMPSDPVLREPSHKGFAPWVYADPATLGRRKPICNMFHRLCSQCRSQSGMGERCSPRSDSAFFFCPPL